MAKIDTTGTTPDRARAILAGTFGATGQSASIALKGAFNLLLAGTFVATVALERSFDGGSTWHNVARNDLSPNAFSAPISMTVPGDESGEPDVLYRLNCTAYTSGTVTYRLSQ
jgi:hypothetical protein